jgi:UDP-N-acetyl-D-glucosamine/UDP-N-acetyl-D-galactosamine dehydrogenase
MNGGTATIDSFKIAVVGLGYVGLPTALAFHDVGFEVCGIDISTRVIDGLKKGKSPLIDNTANFSIPVNSDKWKVTTSFKESIFYSDIVLITVPTPVNDDKTPDLSYIISASENIFDNIDRSKNTIVVLESTVYPGVTREVLGGICIKKGIELNKQVTLAYCPERVNPGDDSRSVNSVAQIIGCDDIGTGEILTELFAKTTTATSTYVGKIEIAEASKMIENVQRDIDIALVNELSIILPKLGIDVEDVLSAADTKWNFHKHTPGIGVGGHCIPVDPYYYMALAEKVGFPSKISTHARKINNSMPIIAAENILKLSTNNSEHINILVLGYSYKPELGDLRETPVKDLTHYLNSKGANVFLWDPLVEKEKLPKWINYISEPLETEEIDCVVLATAHKEVINLDWIALKKCCRKCTIYDGRRVLNKDKMEQIGWKYTGIGVPE